ncbi:NUDIX domain-containing protein [Streptomyces sp. NPDC050560]|uniref:NUDIX domain-containing protein n=1 Tax=Streptomyces sp. NPDC050560 TaxID=3365630 RepID=UPI00379BBB83
MTQKYSAGLLLFRRAPAADGPAARDPAAAGVPGRVEVLLGHMGGPFWARRHAGAWTVPKGEYEDPETPLDAARREFTEELGVPPPQAAPIPLGRVRQSGGKVVTVWAVPGDLDPGAVVPGTFTMEWPRGSGRVQTFPELDRVAWFGLTTARTAVVSAQAVFLDRLAEHLGAG